MPTAHQLKVGTKVIVINNGQLPVKGGGEGDGLSFYLPTDGEETDAIMQRLS